MRQAVFRMTIIMMVFAAMGAYGCSSSSDPLDEVGQRYTATLSVLELDEETLQVDVYRDVCTDENGTVEYEDFSDALGEFTITAGEDSAGLTLKSYSIEYIPLSSSDQMGTARIPPDLTDILENGATSVDVPQGGSIAFTTTLISMDTKSEYLVRLAADSTLQYLVSGRYLIRVTLNFEAVNGDDVDIVVERTVYFSDYDHC